MSFLSLSIFGWSIAWATFRLEDEPTFFSMPAHMTELAKMIVGADVPVNGRSMRVTFRSLA